MMEIQVQEQQQLTEEQKLEIEERHRQFELERRRAYVDALIHIKALQHRIDDAAQVAATDIAKIVGKYNHHFKNYEMLLRTYAQEHAGVNKTTGEKEKHHKLTEAGGGVFFTATPEKITINKELLPLLYENLEGIKNMPADMLPKGFDKESFDLSRFIDKNEVTVYEVVDPGALVTLLKQFNIMLDHYGIAVTEAQAYANMKVGTSRGWTSNKAKEKLTKALDAQLEEEE